MLPHVWVHVRLPGVRETARRSIYEKFDGSNLPPIPIELDDANQWLMRHGVEHLAGLDDREKDGVDPTLATRFGIPLPQSFQTFLTSADQQSRVRSVTDCFLDPGERSVRTKGEMEGALIHFLSDSQFCYHWYLHVSANEAKQVCVLGSEEAFCYGPATTVKVDSSKFHFAAATFSEFLYRFWIENEIWLALADEDCVRPLNDLETDYVNHYLSAK